MADPAPQVVEVRRVEPNQQGPEPAPRRLTISRKAMAITVAVVADLLSLVAQAFEPAELVLDIFTALLLIVILGWRWSLAPAIFAEAVPGLATVPSWTLVTLYIAASE